VTEAARFFEVGCDRFRIEDERRALWELDGYEVIRMAEALSPQVYLRIASARALHPSICPAVWSLGIDPSRVVRPARPHGLSGPARGRVPLLVAADPRSEHAEIGAQQGEIGSVARGRAAELVVEAQVRGGVERGHAQALLER
jgi:hypothetical protein